MTKTMDKTQIIGIINQVLSKQGHPAITDEKMTMRDANFRSLDFSEVALRIEHELDDELNFEASTMRQIQTINDVIEFFIKATSNA